MTVISEQPSVRREMGVDAQSVSSDMGSGMLQGLPSVAHTRSPERVVSKEYSDHITSLSRRCEYLTFSNPKTLKGLQYGYITAILHLAPAKYSGHTTCHRFSQCHETCLYHQGRGRMNNVSNARIRRTRNLFENYEDTMEDLTQEISYLKSKLRGQDMPSLAVRLNGLSDLVWESKTSEYLEGKTLFDWFPDVQFYDYTKYRYGTRPAWKEMPLNYHLTYSFDGTERDVDNCLDVLEAGHNVNVVYSKTNYDKMLNDIDFGILHKWGYPMYDNEIHDLRFTDARPVVLISKEKGYSDLAV